MDVEFELGQISSALGELAQAQQQQADALMAIAHVLAHKEGLEFK